MDTTTERPVASVEPAPAVSAPAQHARLVPGLTVQLPPREPFPWHRWTLLAWPAPTDAELDFLATGKFD